MMKGTKWYMHPADVPHKEGVLTDDDYIRGVWGFAAGNQSLDLMCVDVSEEDIDNRLSWWIDFEERPELGGFR